MTKSLTKLLSGEKNFEGETFENLDLDLTQLLDHNFEDCVFINCKFNNVNFHGTKMQNVRFEACKITGVDFSILSKFLIEMHFEETVLEVCTFSNQKLQDLSFQNSSLKECDFTSCNLQKVHLGDTDLKGTTFIDCDLRQTDFKTAQNYFFDLNQNKVKGAKFSQPEVLTFLSPYGLKIS